MNCRPRNQLDKIFADNFFTLKGNCCTAPGYGKSVVVTGASRGIGKSIARIFARCGGKVFVVGRDQTAAEVAAARHGGIDILVSNAGMYPERPIDGMTGTDWDAVMDANLKGNFHVVRACLPALKQCGQGRFVMISSITGPITGVVGWAHYGASKAGMLSFMRGAALEFAPHGITVNAVLPGNIVVESYADFTAAQVAAMNEAIPPGRMGDVEDIAYAALFPGVQGGRLHYRTDHRGRRRAGAARGVGISVITPVCGHARGAAHRGRCPR